MKPESKLVVEGVVMYVIAMFFMIWGISDFIYLFDAPAILIFIIPAAITVAFSIILLTFYLRVRQKNVIFKENAIYRCNECGSSLRLEQIRCKECGAENAYRKEALERLKELENSIEERKVRLLQGSQSKKWKSSRTKKLESLEVELLRRQAKRVKDRKTTIIVGSSSLEEKVNWIKAQYLDMHKSVQEIAELLGETDNAVRYYLDLDINK
jgi:hypothetical protein